VVKAKAKVDANTSVGNVIEVEIQLGCECCALSISVLDEAHCSNRKEGFGRARVECRRGLVKEDVGVGGMMEGRRGREVDAVRTVLLEEKNKFGGQDVWQRLENRNSFFVDCLNPSFHLVAMFVWSCMGDKDIKGCSQRLADSLGVGTKAGYKVSTGVVGCNELL